MLGDAWRQIPRLVGEKEDKHNTAIAAFFQLMFSVNMITSLLPPELVAANQQLNPEKTDADAPPQSTTRTSIVARPDDAAGGGVGDDAEGGKFTSMKEMREMGSGEASGAGGGGSQGATGGSEREEG